VSAIRDIVRSAGFDKVTLFQCDWSSNFTRNGLDDLVWTMNFGTGANIDEQFQRLKELRPSAPLMCSEFWSGWFDKWGARHETRPADDMVAGIDEMLSKGISFSLYMTHGGTSFGHWAGANSPGFAPDVTSYDYDAPINEYGLATPKYTLLRDVLQKYADKRLPAVPSLPAALISVPQFSLTEYAPLTAGITRTVRSRDVQTMEELDMGFGSMVYETSLPALDRPSLLTLTDAHDFAQVYVDGAYIGKIDRVKNEKSLLLPAVKEGARLTITLEAMGRINFGRAIKDFKGITEGVTVHTESPSGHELTYDLKQWTIGLIPDAYEDAVKALKAASPSEISPLTTRAGYYRGYFTLKKTGDTFLNTSAFGKGQVYVNGHALGRYWKIGPQQTLYVPGCWLKKGRNEVIVLDVVGPEADATLFAEDHPQLDELHLEKSNKHNDPGMRPDLNSATPVATGAFAAGNGWQTVRFGAPAKGRYLAIECRSTHQGDAVAIAELYALDGSGQRLSREPWTARYADSENEFGNHTLDKVFDLQESTYWQTEKGTSLPHLLVIDLGAERELTGIDYLPRAEQGAPGSVKDFAVFVY
jgi:beta-galactosidase